MSAHRLLDDSIRKWARPPEAPWSSRVVERNDIDSDCPRADGVRGCQQARARNGMSVRDGRRRRSQVRETITISVEALSRDYLGPAACGGSAYLSVPATVHLSAPVGHRTLIDARDGSKHAVLALSTVPTLKSLPPGFTKRGASWDESTGVIYQWWRRTSKSAQIDL